MKKGSPPALPRTSSGEDLSGSHKRPPLRPATRLGSGASTRAPGSPTLRTNSDVLETTSGLSDQEFRARFVQQANVDAKLERELRELKAKLALVRSGLQSLNTLDEEHMRSLKAELTSLDDSQGASQMSQREVDKAEEIIAYMVHASADENLDLWFGKANDTDMEIWARFGEDVIKASGGSYDHWCLDAERPRMLLAVVILLDQFRRNMFRNTNQMYTCDKKCQFFVKRAIAAGMDERLSPIERIFLCLALTHAEDVDTQLQCVSAWERVQVHFEPSSPYHVFREIFQRHAAVVQAFGRQPYRNALLGRENTPAEDAFLKDDTFRFDLPLKRDAEGHYAFDRGPERKTSFLGRMYVTYARERKPAGHPAEPDPLPNPTQLRWDHPDRELVARAQIEHQGALRVGGLAPNFSADTTRGPINLYKYLGDSWGVLFSHPADFTPICTTELGEVARIQGQGVWDELNVKILALSVDPLEEHLAWVKDIESSQGVVLDYPIIDDKERRISMAYGMLDLETRKRGAQAGMTATVRSVFVISPSKHVQLILTYPSPIGRNFHEILRAIHALQVSSKYHVATPVNWQPGQDTVVPPSIPTEEAQEMFGGGIKWSPLSYLRYVADPEAAEKKNAGIRDLWNRASERSEAVPGHRHSQDACLVHDTNVASQIS
eukprot:jgi/Mesvir1/14936/Mv25027-RA.1